MCVQCVCRSLHITAHAWHAWRPEDDFFGIGSLFRGLNSSGQAVSLGSKKLYPLSHLTGSSTLFLRQDLKLGHWHLIWSLPSGLGCWLVCAFLLPQDLLVSIPYSYRLTLSCLALIWVLRIWIKVLYTASIPPTEPPLQPYQILKMFLNLHRPKGKLGKRRGA